MRQFFAIARMTALEIRSDPLAMLLASGAVAMATMASVLHFHQFGESARMARDAGVSAIMVFGLLHSVFPVIRVFRREIETGTMQMALARSVSRGMFFSAKLAGAIVSSLLFLVTAVSASAIAVGGAEVGGAIAAKSGDIARIWGGAVALNAAIILLPLCIAAALNRFRSRRFTATAASLSGWTSAAALVLMFAVAGPSAAKSMAKFFTAAAVAAMPAFVFAAAAAAFSVRWRDNAAAAACGVLSLAALPVLSNYCLSDALSKGGAVSVLHAAHAFAAALPLAAGFFFLGLFFISNRDAG